MNSDYDLNFENTLFLPGGGGVNPYHVCLFGFPAKGRDTSFYREKMSQEDCAHATWQLWVPI